ncbi:MAG: hypothetical protein HYU36_01450 [Planctomycetes bacterium]|nr:hypothetical protein [Planctomycetota bacterium]
MGYLSSYSHRGKYYTLKDIPDFDESGLWSYESVWFSKYGNLVETAKELVDEAEAGFSASELESILHVECKRPLLELSNGKRVHREKHSGVYTYFSTDKGKQRSQRLLRREQVVNLEIGVAPEIEVLTHELKAAIILFFSLLDEKQRRLYAGLEAQKIGHGGDRKIADLLGLDVGTVAKGRRELFGGEIERERIRKEGGGRKSLEKKRPIF